MADENDIPDTPPIPGVPEGEGKTEESNQQEDKTPPTPAAAVLGPEPKFNPKKLYKLIRGKDIDIWIQNGNKFIGGKFAGKVE